MVALIALVLLGSFIGQIAESSWAREPQPQEAQVASGAARLAAKDSEDEKLPASAREIISPLPFRHGEVLTYDATVSKAIFSGRIGELKLSVLQTPEHKKRNVLELRADAVSKGFFPGLLGIRIKDSFVATVDAVDFGVYESARRINENSTRRDYKSTFDREKGIVTFTEVDLAKAKSDPRVRQKASPSWVQDVLSVIYFVRTQPLKDAQVIPVPLSDLGENYNIEVVVEKREEIKTRAGRFKSVCLNARVFDGKFTRRSGELRVWISDDERRLPVFARLKTSGYTATVELKSIVSPVDPAVLTSSPSSRT